MALFFICLQQVFFAHFHVSKENFWEWFEIFKKKIFQAIKALEIFKLYEIICSKRKLSQQSKYSIWLKHSQNSNCKKFGIWPQGKSSELCKYFTGSISAKLLQFPFHTFWFSWYFNWGTNIKGIFTQIGFKFHGLNFFFWKYCFLNKLHSPIFHPYKDSQNMIKFQWQKKGKLNV